MRKGLFAALAMVMAVSALVFSSQAENVSVRGDYVELLPTVLAERDEDALTVVFQTASTGYIGPERRAELRGLLEEAGREGPLGWISTRAVEELEEDRHDSYELEIGLWPRGERRFLLRCDFHGNWIRWRS